MQRKQDTSSKPQLKARKPKNAKAPKMSRDDLSFTSRYRDPEYPDHPRICNWSPLVVPDQINQWGIGRNLGLKMMDELAKLASVSEQEAFDAIRFAFNCPDWRPSNGTEFGFSEGVAALAMIGLRHIAQGGEPFDLEAFT